MLTKSERAAALRQRYGELLTLAELAQLLKYPSVGALHKARFRNKLPLQLVQMPPRKRWYATVDAVAELLCCLEQGHAVDEGH
jgi:hypothetical protein